MTVSAIVRKESHRILMVSARSDIGGGPAHMLALAKGLVDTLSIYAVLPEDGVFFNKFIELVGLERVFKIPRQRLTLRALWGLRRFCKQNEIDLIHSHGKGAGLYSRLVGLTLGVPVVHTLHGYHDGSYSWVLKQTYALWEALAGLLTRKIICVSASEASIFKSKVCVVPDKLVIVPNGTAVQVNVVAEPTPNKVVSVARFDYQKNLHELLRVAERLPGYDFFVIGDGADRAEIEAQIMARNLHNVTLCGASHTVLEDIANAAVYLTTARWEGLPLAVLEAMSLGIPVVATDVVGNKDAVASGITGYLYPLGDIDACTRSLAAAIKLSRSEIQAYHRLHFSVETMVLGTQKVYEQVL